MKHEITFYIIKLHMGGMELFFFHFVSIMELITSIVSVPVIYSGICFKEPSTFCSLCHFTPQVINRSREPPSILRNLFPFIFQRISPDHAVFSLILVAFLASVAERFSFRHIPSIVSTWTTNN